MNPPKPFPILRLPFLALEKIFIAMHPLEIVNFSLITKKTKQVAKSMTFYPRYSTEVDICEKPDIGIRGSNKRTSCTFIMTSNQNKNGKIVENKLGNSIELLVYKYSMDPVEEWMTLYKHISEVFKNQSINRFSMTMDAFVDQTSSIIDFLKANVKTVDECTLLSMDEEEDVDEHVANFLNNIEINHKLESDVEIKDENFDARIPKSLQRLSIVESHWIKYEKLLELDSKTLLLWNTRISNEEWNLFLKKWIAMETHLNLEYLGFSEIELDDFREIALHDIPCEVVDKEVERLLMCQGNNKIVKGGIDIKRIDGKTATFNTDNASDQDIYMIIH